MSEVLTYFRQKDSRFEAVPDDELTSFIGQKHPEFLQSPEFSAEFQRVRPSESLQPAVAQPFGPAQPVLTKEEAVRQQAQENTAIIDEFEAALSLAGDNFEKRAALKAAHKQVMAERGVTMLDKTEMETLRTPVADVSRLTGEEVQALTGLGPTSSKVVAGVEQAAAGLTEFFLTPLAWTAMGLAVKGGAVAQNTAALFAADMISSMPQQAMELYEAFKAKDVERTTAAMIGLPVTALFARGALRHATPEYTEARVRSGAMLEKARQTATLLADPTISGLPATPKEVAQLAIRRGVRVVDSVPEVPVT